MEVFSTTVLLTLKIEAGYKEEKKKKQAIQRIGKFNF
jgi:hypothetical protein